jgi:hypothetical protein
VNQDERDLHVCPVARIDGALKAMNGGVFCGFLITSHQDFDS